MTFARAIIQECAEYVRAASEALGEAVLTLDGLAEAAPKEHKGDVEAVAKYIHAIVDVDLVSVDRQLNTIAGGTTDGIQQED